MPPRTRDTPAKFYQEDLVRRVVPQQTNNLGLVLRCWHDSEELPPPAAQHSDPLLRPLNPGEVGVSYLPTGKREICPEDDFQLIDRTFHTSDICKRSVNDVRCGIVVEVDIKARLFHAISGHQVPDLVSHDKLKSSVDYFIGDFVLCDDWVGQIEEVFEENTVQVGNSTQLVRLPQLGPGFGVGDRGNDILPAQPQTLLNLLARTLRSNNTVPDVVVHVIPTVLAITWLAVNQKLSKEEAATKARPQRYWSGKDLSRLIMVHNRSEDVVRVGERVVFKTQEEARAAGVVPTEHGKAGDGPGIVQVWDLIVSETQTRVKVLWQDGTIESDILAVDLVPYLNVDESEVWPGDHTLWKFEDERRVGVVQAANAHQRTATVRWYASGGGTSAVDPAPAAQEVVSVLELDPHGYSAAEQQAAGDSAVVGEMFGVRRAEFVFIHREGATNGLALPRVPKIGEVEPWVREVVPADGEELQGWRKEMFEIGWKLASSDELVTEYPRCGDPSGIDWFGEVSDLRTDGLIEVMLPDQRKVVVPLERLTLLQDGLDPTVEDMWGDEYEDDMVEEEGDVDMEIEYEDPRDADAHSEGSWETMPEEDRDDWGDVPENDTDAMEVEPEPSVATPEVETPASAPAPAPTRTEPGMVSAAQSPAPASDEMRTPSPLVVPVPAEPSASTSRHPTRQAIFATTDEDEDAWQRFSVLPSAPVDHAFYGTPPVQPTKAFTSRINKEFRVLSNNLPETILVRTYEDRSDLLRSLIIGPENTPYEDAPFVIDWMLDADFPQTPPKAHFLSWTNGNGRVNPNLYEEGKVCLSILGTWAGDAAESWSAAKSSLFQVFLSIQGLVLVKEPWFCEPAYDKLRGTVDGTVNSRLYSERAYVLSRGFVRRALEIPLNGLEEEIHWLYYKKGMLEKVLRDANTLIEKSKDASDEHPKLEPGEEDLAVPRLTAGGVITLSRTLKKLQALLDAHQASPSATASS